jgi:hypothetical protein
MLRHERRTIALIAVIATGDFGIEIGVGGNGNQPISEIESRLGLDAAVPDLAGLDLEDRIVRIGRQYIGLVNLKRRQCEQRPRVGSYLTPASYCVPSDGSNRVPFLVVPTLVTKDSAYDT